MHATPQQMESNKYTAFLRKSRSAAAVQQEFTSSTDIKPWMSRRPLSTLESSTNDIKKDQTFLAQLGLQRRSSSTSAVEKQSVSRKRPVIDLGARKTHEEELLNHTHDSFVPRPISTPSQIPKNPMRRTLSSLDRPLVESGKTIQGHKDKTAMFRSTTGFEKANIHKFAMGRAYHTFEIDDPFVTSPTKSKHKESLSSTHTAQVKGLQEHLLSSSPEDSRRSRVQSIVAKTSQADSKSAPSSAAKKSREFLSSSGFKQSRGGRGICEVSIELGCPFDLTMDAQAVFNLYAVNGSLGYSSFGEIVQHIMNITKQVLSKEEMQKKIDACWREADRNFNGKVEFDEFAIWYSSWGFQQELLLSPQKIRTRDFAKKYSLSYADVDAVYTKFQHFDEDKSGLIEFGEFKKLLYKLLKVPRGQDLPANRLNFFWKEIDIDGSGTVCMDEFLQWYAKYFDVKGNSDVSPIEQFYQSVRPNMQSWCEPSNLS
eukprot:gnl/MRDRNA2_/MRDRNA2_81021_c0_seq7.p1 gnl/MRDRNA2_/MRDRNA2_81021_c0~~gnl/MRDRNA2_/MRDRNA2_81021_c0_seq7.p1  ORF type:complete len:484 (-),score=83.84 gnl/MRDRNA2_/MRDRNA2_81021_c0_seq7:410-1861(-)